VSPFVLDITLNCDEGFALAGTVIQHDMKAVLGEAMGDTFADSPGGTSDEGDASDYHGSSTRENARLVPAD
jgi:hypothetical protein